MAIGTAAEQVPAPPAKASALSLTAICRLTSEMKVSPWTAGV